MKWKRIVRASGLIEWQCEHGVGHPDENSVVEMGRKTDDATWGVHGCDGCCSREDFPGRLRRKND